MKSQYEEVIRWVRLNTWACWYEARLCGQNVVGSLAAPFLTQESPAGVPIELLSYMEEVASAAWLLDREHAALLERMVELFAPHKTVEVLDSTFQPPSQGFPGAALTFVGRSIQTRITLLEKYPRRVDSHTRLVFKRHVAILRGIIVPTIDVVVQKMRAGVLASSFAESAGTASREQLLQVYQGFLPPAPRPHRDSFAGMATLKPDPSRTEGPDEPPAQSAPAQSTPAQSAQLPWMRLQVR